MGLYGDFVPSREAELDEFIHNFDTRATELGTAIGLTSAQCTGFHTLVVAWDAAYAVTKNKATRCTSACIVKDEKKFAVVKQLRALARIVQSFQGTTNEQRSLLGLTVPTVPQSQPAPGSAPALTVTKVVGNTASVRLSDSENPGRLRPAFAKSCNVFSYIGNNPPTSSEGWVFQGGTTRCRFDIALDSSLPMGTKVYLCAFWKNERDMSGPACQPVAVTLLGAAALPGGVQQSDGESLALAA
jgi:hypothetical protein